MLLLSRIGTARKICNYPEKARKLPKRDCTIQRDCTITLLNQYHKLKNIKMKQLRMVKKKQQKRLKSAEKDHVRLK